MAKTDEERLREAEQRIQRLKLASAKLKKKIADKERKSDTRRKIIAGGIVLKHASIDENFQIELHKLLDRFVDDRDRHLFDLPESGKPE